MPRLIDAMMFFSELELLKVRLDHLRPMVDEFVIVECDHDHAGREIEPVFLKNRDLFKGFPIRHVMVTDLPTGPDNWPRVWAHRNAMLRGLVDADDEDIVLTSDLDEIPNVNFLPIVRDEYMYPVTHGRVGMYHHRSFYVHPEMEAYDAARGVICGWGGTRECTVKTLRQIGPEGARHRQDYIIGNEASPGGWHFSYFGGPERISRKIQAIAESTQYNRPEFTDIDKIVERVNAGRDIYDRHDQHWVHVPFDASRFPKGMEQFLWRQK